MDIYIIHSMALRLGSYKHWFVGREKEGKEYINKSIAELKQLFNKYNL